jgi:hypothetical protein
MVGAWAGSRQSVALNPMREVMVMFENCGLSHEMLVGEEMLSRHWVYCGSLGT